MLRGFIFIVLALILDGFQALISLGLAVIAAFPGTAGGCAVGQAAAGTLGCVVLGALGSIPVINGALATVTVPIGVVAGFAITICLSLTIGAGLITAMHLAGVGPKPTNLIFGIGEALPGLNNIPFWTALVLTTLWQHKKKAALGGVLATATGATMGAKGLTTSLIEKRNGYSNPRTPEWARNEKESQDREGDWLQRSENQAGSQQDAVAANRARQVLQDIRPIRTAAALLLAIALGVSGSPSVHAQTLQPDPVQFTISPEVPEPFQTVRIEVQGVGTFLGDATISWQKDGVPAASGVGQRAYSFTAGALGSQTRVGVTITSPTQGTITRTFTFIPSVINLLWEADTSVPPLYRGKALYSAGSQLKVVAFPQVVANGSTLSSNNLSFQWKRNGTTVTDQSGKGRNTFTFAGDQLKGAENISVDVYFDTVLVGKGSISIPATSPLIRLYVRDPLRGILFTQALPSVVELVGQELTLQAAPYYFANESLRSGTLAYAWSLNGEPTTGPDAAQGSLTLRQAGQGSGAAQVRVSLQDNDSTRLFQAAEAFLRITFGGQRSGSVFGL